MSAQSTSICSLSSQFWPYLMASLDSMAAAVEKAQQLPHCRQRGGRGGRGNRPSATQPAARPRATAQPQTQYRSPCSAAAHPRLLLGAGHVAFAVAVGPVDAPGQGLQQLAAAQPPSAGGGGGLIGGLSTQVDGCKLLQQQACMPLDA